MLCSEIFLRNSYWVALEIATQSLLRDVAVLLTGIMIGKVVDQIQILSFCISSHLYSQKYFGLGNSLNTSWQVCCRMTLRS